MTTTQELLDRFVKSAGGVPKTTLIMPNGGPNDETNPQWVTRHSAYEKMQTLSDCTQYPEMHDWGTEAALITAASRVPKDEYDIYMLSARTAGLDVPDWEDVQVPIPGYRPGRWRPYGQLEDPGVVQLPDGTWVRANNPVLKERNGGVSFRGDKSGRRFMPVLGLILLTLILLIVGFNVGAPWLPLLGILAIIAYFVFRKFGKKARR
jgi:hypothetical protein